MSGTTTVGEFLRQQAGMRHGAGASAADIRELETAWGGQLPGDYAEFLKTFGWVVYGSTEIAGLGRDVPGHLDVSNLAGSLWNGRARLPKDLLPFYDSGGGWYYCLSKRRSKVVLWALEYGEEQPYEETYESWARWFHDYMMT
jgi:hypothetical protein